MNRRLPFLLPSSCLLVLLAVVAAWRGPAAAAAPEQTMTVYMSSEAWYDETPPCVSLIDCSALPSPTPYPEDTLHVSVAAGQETARTYLAFAIAVPSGGNITDATLTLPLDTDPGDGSVAPDTAAITACPVSAEIEPVRGSLDAPPKANCALTSSATYDEKTASFVIDLTPFAGTWQDSAAIALVASDKAKQPSATWHTVFHATTKPSKDAPPIIVTIAYTTPSSPAAPAPSSPEPAGGTGTGTSQPPTGGGGAPSFSGGGGGFTFPSTTTTTTTTTTTSQPGTQSVAAAPPTSLAGFAGPGFAYPMVWALPLLFLIGIGAIGHALTKELYRRDH
jgi:hypothetical protein